MLPPALPMVTAQHGDRALLACRRAGCGVTKCPCSGHMPLLRDWQGLPVALSPVSGKDAGGSGAGGDQAQASLYQADGAGGSSAELQFTPSPPEQDSQRPPPP